MSQQSNAKFQQTWKVINYSLRFTPNTTDGDFRKEERQRGREEGRKERGTERPDLTYTSRRSLRQQCRGPTELGRLTARGNLQVQCVLYLNSFTLALNYISLSL